MEKGKGHPPEVASRAGKAQAGVPKGKNHLRFMRYVMKFPEAYEGEKQFSRHAQTAIVTYRASFKKDCIRFTERLHKMEVELKKLAADVKARQRESQAKSIRNRQDRRDDAGTDLSVSVVDQMLSGYVKSK